MFKIHAMSLSVWKYTNTYGNRGFTTRNAFATRYTTVDHGVTRASAKVVLQLPSFSIQDGVSAEKVNYQIIIMIDESLTKGRCDIRHCSVAV